MGLGVITTILRKRFREVWRIDWLNIMLWGGVLMLAVEHFAHREIVPYPPFLTAGIEEVLPEMLSIGVPMTLAIVALWVALITIPLKAKDLLRQ